MSSSATVPLLQWDVGSQVFSIAVSHNGTRVASGSHDGLVRIWDIHTGSLDLELLRGHSDWVQSVVWSHDDARIVSASDDETIRVWDASTGAPVGEPLTGHTGTVYSVAFSSDSTRIVSGSHDNNVRMWDAYTGAPIGNPLKGHTRAVQSVAFAPDNTRIVSGSYDDTIRMWNPRTGDPIGQPLRGHTDWVYSVAFSHDSTRIISASRDKTIRIWDASTGAPIGKPFEGHTSPVYSVAFSPDSTHFVSGSEDNTIRMWDATSHAPIGEPFNGHVRAVWSVAFSSDCTHIVSGSVDRTIRVWRAPKHTPSFEMVNSKMSAQEIFECLLRHGCISLASSIDTDSAPSAVIASGGFGDVRRMITNDGTPVAVKTLRLHVWERDDDKAIKRAVRKVHMWFQLRHANVQELLGIIIFHNGLGMVSPWRKQGNLSQYIQAYPDIERYSLCAQLASGVVYLHGVDMVHGDLKANNVLVSDDGTLKINDFDYAMLPETSLQFSATTRLGGGTLRWMAPELLQPDGEGVDTQTPVRRDKRTDIYALGMTILEIFSGAVPYAEYWNEMGIYRAIDRRQPPR